MFQEMSVRQLVAGGFAMMLLVIVFIVGTELVGQDRISRDVTEMVDIRQPAALQSLELTLVVDRSVADLGLYMLSKDDSHRQSFLARLADAGESLDRLETALEGTQAPPVTRQTWAPSTGQVDSPRSERTPSTTWLRPWM